MYRCNLGTTARCVGVHVKRFSSKTEIFAVPKEHTLYGDLASPPVRFVMITASLLRMKLRFEHIDLFKAENKTNFYTKINPLQKVPALVFGHEIISDSHAIAIYLCQWKDNQQLYPNKSTIAKAKVDEMLFYNSGTLFPVDSTIYTEFFAGKWPVSEFHIKQWHLSLDHLERRLSQCEWLSGHKMFLSDICCAATVSSLDLLLPIPEKHANVRKWLKRLYELHSFQINKQGIDRLRYKIESIGPII